jgi:hypothetical protein
MNLQSCQNCWFNGLQYGAVGLSVGFCVRHRRVLTLADETTCGLHIRKDLGLARAREVARVHAHVFDGDKIVRFRGKDEVGSDTSGSEKDIAFLKKDPVGEAVVEYGALGSKIESLVQLKMFETARSDLAMTSLGRAYVGNCIRQGGRWTSGIHLFWWTKKRLALIPDLQVGDIRHDGSIKLSRYVELAAWSIMMLRLSFLDDIIQYARQEDDDIGHVGDILNEAATNVPNLSTVKLSAWIKKILIPALEARLNYQRYSTIARELHKEDDSSDEVY